MAVNDHGLEVLKKAGREITPGNKSDYYIQVIDDASAALLTSILSALGGTSTGALSIQLVRNDYTGVPVTTAAYVELVASMPALSTSMFIFDSSGQTLVLAVGPAASEVNQMYIVPGGNGAFNLGIPAGSRVSVKAISGNATVGELSITFLK